MVDVYFRRGGVGADKDQDDNEEPRLSKVGSYRLSGVSKGWRVHRETSLFARRIIGHMWFFGILFDTRLAGPIAPGSRFTPRAVSM